MQEWNFLCGVVEGFYGKPWTISQRAELFVRLSQLGFNTYIYAPKDDIKHRKLWRQLYTEAEAGNLRSLIDICTTRGIDFVYALSPGLDIIFSSPTDMKCLKDKLGQVNSLGCKCFALLFDDIVPELSIADRADFSSFGEAQACTANAAYKSLNNVKTMLFCPTEYCSNRAKPEVHTSEYLKLLGKKLHPEIKIMWTGLKVVSKEITSDSIGMVSNVLQRKPVIWDNIHANDYDRRRIFLGPFKYRPIELYGQLSGLVTNPNCEFYCNYIALHTLSAWLRSAKTLQEPDGLHKCSNNVSDGSLGSFPQHHKDDVRTLSKNDPGIADVLPISSENSESLYDPDKALKDAVCEWLKEFTIERKHISKEERLMDGHPVKLIASDALNSLVSQEISGSEIIEPSVSKDFKPSVSLEDLLLLADFFYLPYEHGQQARDFVSDFVWFKRNSLVNFFSEDLARVWDDRASGFLLKVKSIKDLHDKLVASANKLLCQELCPYVSDLKEVVDLLGSYVTWAGSKDRRKNALLMDDPEPWFFRGGMAAELERLLPFSTGNDINSTNLLSKSCIIRPYLHEDRDLLYKICLDFYGRDSRGISLFPSYPELPGDCLLGPFLLLDLGPVYVVEVNEVVSGYVAAYHDTCRFTGENEERFMQIMMGKYSASTERLHSPTPENNCIKWLLGVPAWCKALTIGNHRAVCSFAFARDAKTLEIASRIMKCTLSCLKLSSLECLFAEVMQIGDVDATFIAQLGFVNADLCANDCDVIRMYQKMF